MRKIILALFVLFCLGLAACGSNANEPVQIPHTLPEVIEHEYEVDYDYDYNSQDEGHRVLFGVVGQDDDDYYYEEYSEFEIDEDAEEYTEAEQTTTPVATTIPTTTPTTTTAVTTTATTTIAEVTEAQYQFVGNVNSLIFHSLDCDTLPASHNRIYFVERDDAIEAGHRGCMRCNP